MRLSPTQFGSGFETLQGTWAYNLHFALHTPTPFADVGKSLQDFSYPNLNDRLRRSISSHPHLHAFLTSAAEPSGSRDALIAVLEQFHHDATGIELPKPVPNFHPDAPLAQHPGLFAAWRKYTLQSTPTFNFLNNQVTSVRRYTRDQIPRGFHAVETEDTFAPPEKLPPLPQASELERIHKGNSEIQRYRGSRGDQHPWGNNTLFRNVSRSFNIPQKSRIALKFFYFQQMLQRFQNPHHMLAEGTLYEDDGEYLCGR
ncbi:MAG: hypothetical protein COX62_06795 [Deltaproteobacteria bacterium CG_4_10_14_0_2_um_filter_43_8]|nr:MAG: hypothetical protein COV43_06605 [Deltaproteobacteria bacterium CG11_big_fil_rev_8_21_14_0_20_42_23]PJA19413.1 MAG: hypothetical protein COX62_06795 [Deltaproteobacteria bacterium CG_4_10_14_0_2_um_filter_43_8]PJC63995.1 MAG: hypothetical protein CO021_06580 [Deltaproteobacteria bacterium CG_4_9_14_0_2_um_filter_42_21]